MEGGWMNFDEAAKNWDAEERRVVRAKAVAERIGAEIGQAPDFRALDFGCGTGLLSFFLRDRFSEITLLDSSAGMIEALEVKIVRDDAARMESGALPGAAMLPMCGTIEPLIARQASFDVAYAMLVLHHIADFESALRGLVSALAPAGTLFVVDFDKDGGDYHRHEEGFKGHDGFNRPEFADLAERTGLLRPHFETVWIERRIEGDTTREYPMFMMKAQKPVHGD
jgi:SAM-dependent methyltransferase